MQTTINVTLGGKIFHVEEPGYTKLKTYLDGLRAHFANNPDGTEIVADIEQAMADHMSERLKPGKEAITEADVDDMIKQMGGAEEMSPDAETPEPEHQDTSETPRRLYRDRDGAMLGGVCTGLGIFFGLDPILFRIAFIIAAISGGWGIVVYILMWILIPEAKTVSDKMKMTGEPITVASIEETANAMFERAKKMARQSATKGKASSLSFGQTLERLARSGWSFTRNVLGLGFLVSSVAGIVFVIVASVILFFRFDRLLVDPIAQELFAQVNTQLLTIFVGVTLLVPLDFGVRIGISMLKNRSIFKPITVLSALALWITALAGLAIVTIDLIPNIKRLEAAQTDQYPTQTQTFTEADFTKINLSSNFDVRIEHADTYSITASANELTLKQLEVRTHNQELFVGRNADECLWFCSDRHLELVITTPNLEQLNVTGAGTVLVTDFTTSDMRVNVRGGTTLDFQNLDTEHLSLDADGYTQISLTGSADTASLELRGVADFDGTNFSINSSQLKTEGAVDVQLQTQELSGKATGISTIHIVNDIDPDQVKNFIIDIPSELVLE